MVNNFNWKYLKKIIYGKEWFSKPQTKLNKIMANPNSAYWDSGHRNHKQTVAQVNKLFIKIYGNNLVSEDDEKEKRLNAKHSFCFDHYAKVFSNYAKVFIYRAKTNKRKEKAKLKKWFFECEIPNEEAKSLVGEYQKCIGLNANARESMKLATYESLRKSWGIDFEKNLTACKEIVSKIGEDFRDTINQSGLGNSHALALALFQTTQKRERNKLIKD